MEHQTPAQQPRHYGHHPVQGGGFAEFIRAHQVILSLCVLIIPNVITWILLFPGYFQADHQSAIASLVAGEPRQWHSLIWAYLATPFFYFSPHYAVYGLAQIGLFVACAFFSIKRLVRIKLIKSMLPLSVFYGLFPTYLLYNELYSSDVCFAALLISLTAMLAEVVESRGKALRSVGFCLKVAVLCFFVLSLRKNALLIGIVLCVLIPLRFRRVWMGALVTFGGALLAAMLVDALFPVLVGATPSPSQEMLSVPSLQIAAVYANDGDVPEEANAYLTTIRSKDDWAFAYEPHTADLAKAGVQLTPEFIKSWIDVGMRNLGTYIVTYLQLEYPFWTLGNSGDNFSAVDFGIHEEFTTAIDGIPSKEYLAQFNGVEGKSDLWLKVMNLQTDFNNLHLPVLTDFYHLVMCNTGLPLWLLVIGLIITRKGRRLDYLTVGTPVACVLLSLLLFAPMPMFRYVIQVYYCMPILMVYLCRRTSHIRIVRRRPRPKSRVRHAATPKRTTENAFQRGATPSA